MLAEFLQRSRDRVTLGVQGCIIDRGGKVLLVRHSYRPGWHFPGGGVERDESVASALARELSEEAGIVATAPPSLFGFYSHFEDFPGDHIALYVVRAFRQEAVAVPNSEIAEIGFFNVAQLPDGTTPGTARRIREIVEGRCPALAW